MIVNLIMIKISLDIDDALNFRLKQFALNKYRRTHGMQQTIIKAALIAYLDTQERKLAEEAATCEASTEIEVAECVVESEPVPPAARRVKKKFGDDVEATKKVRALWASGEQNVSKIARQFPEYSSRQVSYWIDKELKEGREPIS